MQIFPPKLLNLWDKWEIRVFVLGSLFVQVLLILFGSRRRYMRSTWISIIIWLSYLSADAIATISMGILANGGDGEDNKDPNDALRAFWAPFLLLHLGGPDTITAYALEDNELWLRHLLTLLVQLTLALYIFLKSFSNTAITFVAIPMFVAGIIKYGERTWVLRSASEKQFEVSLLSHPAEEASKDVIIKRTSEDPHLYLHEAYFLFCFFKRLSANFSLPFSLIQESHSILGVKKASDAFKLIEIQLGFLYDILYTKATIVYSGFGIFLRVLSCLSTVSSILVFFIFVEKQDYSTIDIYITYALLIGAIALECYAVVLLLLSDWALLWLTKRKPFTKDTYPALTSCKQWCLDVNEKIRLWLNKCSISTRKQKRFESIAQLNLMKFCVKEKNSKFLRWGPMFSFFFAMKTYIHRTWDDEQNDDLEIEIFNYVRGKCKTDMEGGQFDVGFVIPVLAYRGDNVLREKGCLHEFEWSVLKVEFSYSLLLWHTATDICYYHDLENDRKEAPMARRSKCLSDYMLYVLLMRPFMLPKWTNRSLLLLDTYKEVMSLCRSLRVEQEAEACKALLGLGFAYKKELLGYSCGRALAKLLLSGGSELAEQLLTREDRWEIMNGVWLEMLTHAASQCGWRDHAQQLRRGGELLTKVCLLMVNMGLSTQYSINNDKIMYGKKSTLLNLFFRRLLGLKVRKKMKGLKIRRSFEAV